MAKITKNKNEISKIVNIEMQKIKVFYKRSILKSILKILLMEHSGYRTVKSVKNINRLFSNLDLGLYSKSTELLSYIWCINNVSKKWLDGIVNIDLIVEWCKRQNEFDNIKENIIQQCIDDKQIVSEAEAKMIFEMVSEALQFGFLAGIKNEYLTLLDDINLDQPGAFKELADRLFMISHSVIDIKHNTNFVSNKVTFNTSDIESIKSAISQTIESLSSSSSMLKTGIRRLNTLLSPAYMNGRLYIYLGLPAAGKAQPDDTPIPTPNGWKRMDELKIGDQVFNLDGEPTLITGIFPQGVQDTYKVTFTDGRSTRCNIEHLWYTLAKHGQTGEYRPVIRKLREMIDDYEMDYPSEPGKRHHKYIIPNNGIAKFNEREIPIHPWVVGYLIGNGCTKQRELQISSPDHLAAAKMAKLLNKRYEKSHESNYSYFFRNKEDGKRFHTKEILKDIPEIYNSYSYDKCIPESYLYNNENIRMELLRGLMDSDGAIHINRRRKIPAFEVSYSTSSLGLAEDMMSLLRSLGISCSLYTYDPINRTNPNSTRLEYTININTSNQIISTLFSIGSKYEKCIEAFNYRNVRCYNRNRICNIEKVESTTQRCIMVSDPRHVYLTEQYVPTHNSLLLLKSALDIRKFNPEFKTKTPGMKPAVLYITMENGFTETIERIWNMTFDDDIANYNPEEASEKIMEELGIGIPTTYNVDDGEDQLTKLETDNSSNIEIVIKYFAYREICTDDIFTIVQDLRDSGLEVCALILDYIKRIRPNIPVADNVKMELDRICNELKAMSIILDIPVITAHQMNRAAAATVDGAARAGKGDVTRLVGRENVGSAWEVLECADFACILNTEYKPGTDEKFMVFNVVKRRRVDASAGDVAKYTYLAHPYALSNGFRLMNDMHLDKILSVQSLINDVDAIVGKDKANAVPRLNKLPIKDFVDDVDYEVE